MVEEILLRKKNNFNHEANKPFKQVVVWACFDQFVVAKVLALKIY